MQQFLKLAFVKTMPPWDMDELKSARPHARPKVTPDELEKRYDHWGGNVRYCLSRYDQLGEVQLAEAIKFVDANHLTTLVEDVDLHLVRARHSCGIQ